MEQKYQAVPAVIRDGVSIIELRSQKLFWEPKHIQYLQLREGIDLLHSLSGIYRALKRAKMIEPVLAWNAIKSSSGRSEVAPWRYARWMCSVEFFSPTVLISNVKQKSMTTPRSPTTTGKIERLHRSLRV